MPRFVLGPPPKRPTTEMPDWHSVSGYGSSAAEMSHAIGAGIAASIFVGVAWKMVDHNALPIDQVSLSEVFICVLLLSLGHELCHLLAFPGFGLDNKSVCGIWPQAGSPYVLHLDPMKRNQFLFATALPFCLLSLFPLLLELARFNTGNIIAWTSVLNAIGSGADLLACYLLLRAAPANAKVLENGHALYWQA